MEVGGSVAPSIAQVDSLVEVLVTLSCQFHPYAGVDVGERALARGVLAEALQQIDCACRDLEDHGTLREHTSRSLPYAPRTLEAVFEWIWSDDRAEEDDEGYAYSDICEILDLHVDYVRRLVWFRVVRAVELASEIRDGRRAAKQGSRARRRRNGRQGTGV